MPRPSKAYPDPVNRFVGSMVKLHRMIRGYTQEQLAEAIKVSAETMRRYEKGDQSMTPRRIASVAAVLGVSPSVFFQGTPTEFGRLVHVDTGSMGNADTRRLLRAWDALTGNARKRFLGLAISLAQACRERTELARLREEASNA